MDKVKHIQLVHDLPIGTRFTLDTWPDKTFEVVKAERQNRQGNCDVCFFNKGLVSNNGFDDNCCSLLLCSRFDRKDKTYVIYKEVKE